MEVVKENDVVSLKLTQQEAIKGNLFNKEDALEYNVQQCYCSVCTLPFSFSDNCYLCGDNDELLCEDCYNDYISYGDNFRTLGTQVRKLNKFLDKHNFKKRINAQTFKLEEL